MIAQLQNNPSKIAMILIVLLFIGCKPLSYDKTMFSGHSNRIIVTGQVTDQNTGLPMPAVRISTIDQLSQTSTDKNGKYILAITGSLQKLRAVWIGYHHVYTKKLKLKIGDTAVVNFKMRYDTKPLN